jgi:hypothetical protein
MNLGDYVSTLILILYDYFRQRYKDERYAGTLYLSGESLHQKANTKCFLTFSIPCIMSQLFERDRQMDTRSPLLQ